MKKLARAMGRYLTIQGKPLPLGIYLIVGKAVALLEGVINNQGSSHEYIGRYVAILGLTSGVARAILTHQSKGSQ